MGKKSFKGIAEEMGWKVNVYGNETELENWMDNGMDFAVTIEGRTNEERLQSLKDFYYNYNPDEEALIESQCNGAPALRYVLADCDQAADEMEDLIFALKEII